MRRDAKGKKTITGKIAPMLNNKMPSLFLRSKIEALLNKPCCHSCQVDLITEGKNKTQGKHQQAVIAR